MGRHPAVLPDRQRRCEGHERNNSPLKGFKASNYEGGLRTPFVASWPARFTGGKIIDTPVISLDILPTALDALGVPTPAAAPFDGKSLLPLLAGKTSQHHDALFWSSGGEGEWSVRQGDWKLHAIQDQLELINLAEDPGETTNLAAKHPEKVDQLTALYDQWLEPMADGVTSGPKRPGDTAPREPAGREAKRRGDARQQRDENKQSRLRRTRWGRLAPWARNRRPWAGRETSPQLRAPWRRNRRPWAGRETSPQLRLVGRPAHN